MDFVEVPSQLMEYFSWNKEVLKKFGFHYKSKEPIPNEYVYIILYIYIFFKIVR